MTMFGYSELPARPVRALRRLNHSTIVKTSYLSRVAEIEVADEESSEAARQGYEDGYAGGLAKAALEAAATREEEHKRVELALAAVSKALASVQEADSLLRSELGTTVPKVAFALLEELLGRELELSANPGREAVARALALVESSQHATIRLNPRDIELLGDIGDLTFGHEASVIADPGVEPGGALVDVGGATVDAQVGTALERVRKVLLGPVSVEVGE